MIPITASCHEMSPQGSKSSHRVSVLSCCGILKKKPFSATRISFGQVLPRLSSSSYLELGLISTTWKFAWFASKLSNLDTLAESLRFVESTPTWFKMTSRLVAAKISVNTALLLSILKSFWVLFSVAI